MSENFTGRNNAKWGDDVHIKFVELCEQEIRKGNRPNTYLSRKGWKNMVNEFNKKTGRIENAKYKKFRNKDLSLIWFRYDALFPDIVATGERARAASQEQMSGIGLDLDDEINNFYGYDQGEQFGNLNDEKSDDSDDILQHAHSVRFPEPSLKKLKSIDGVGTSSQGKKSKAKYGAVSLKHDIHSLLEMVSNKSSATSLTTSEATIEKCIDLLVTIPGISEGSEIFNFSLNLLVKKETREIFSKLYADEARKSWLEYNYQSYLKKQQ
ncbi:uncharacterized protein LOC142167342 [Nicotiana tabacum]|uniref:Uncharacterized protein LOC142167342 n=1 Tax=Nicotiana tabacum TaxID=4097 RepID=A0AC58SF64_TOBAC